MKRVGISSDGGKTCSLWVEVDKNDNGRMYFTVINGAWRGSIKDGMARITRDRDWLPDESDLKEWKAEICWNKDIPKEFDKGYNTTMAYIDEQLAKRVECPSCKKMTTPERKMSGNICEHCRYVVSYGAM